MELVVLYISGLLVVVNIMLVVRDTDILLKALRWFKIIPDDTFTWEDFENYAALKMGWFGELLICFLCLSSQLGGLIGLILVFFGAPFWFPLFTFFSYPLLSLVIYKLIAKL